MKKPMAMWSKGLALTWGALVVVLGVARVPAAATTVIQTVYNGSECRPGSYNAQAVTVTKNGHINSTSSNLLLGPMCPIVRNNPTLPFVMVEAFFMDTSTASEENATASVTCRVAIRLHTGGNNTSDGRWAQTHSNTMTGIYHQGSLMVSYAALEQASQPFWTSITSTTAPAWQRADFNCDSLPANIAVRSYVVTESN